MITSAKIIADTINPHGARITTFEVTAPRFLLAEVNTHGVIAKSAASSRAIPVDKRVAMVLTDPFVPKAFGKNQRGMQASENMGENDTALAREEWIMASRDAAKRASFLADMGVHKQHANRVIEPYVYYAGVLTGTEWDNFWKLRTHKDAQPEFQELAELMRDVYGSSKPVEGSEHLPYTDDCRSAPLADKFMISSARCARVSYKTFDGAISTLDKDLQLCRDLVASGHMSPFDHAAISDTVVHRFDDIHGFGDYWANPQDHGRFWGFIPYRVEVEKSQGWVSRRSSFDPLP